MILRKICLASACFVLPGGLALAHGEDKPGPHGGHMRMPGAYHTELLSEGDASFIVYLLDVQFKNPDTKRSSLAASARVDGKDLELKCEVQVDRFLCRLPHVQGKPATKADQLVIKAKYLEFPPGVSTYDLPLQFAQSTR